ncbi:MAG TPA: hypothetical protein VMU94_11975 [Streptosporangiaceae bacterium]|nr:hypothetical protein [Streptosporangiaceae bacterium]
MTVLAASQSILDQPGTVAFLVIFGMGVILFFVFRSMSKHLGKINMAARAEAEAAARAQGGTESEADSQSRAGAADRSA